MSIQILVEDSIQKLFEENPDLNDSDKDKFEVAVGHFVSLHCLYGIDSDDVLDGIIGNGGDEGIDMCYVFCNGFLVKEDDIPITSDSVIKVKFFQNKKEKSFSANAFLLLKEGIESIFDLSISEKQLKANGANPQLIKKAKLIRSVFRKAQIESASFSCEVYYITVAAEVKVPVKIPNKFEVELKITLLV